jgi:hypothetical protein
MMKLTDEQHQALQLAQDECEETLGVESAEWDEAIFAAGIALGAADMRERAAIWATHHIGCATADEIRRLHLPGEAP